MTEKICPFLSIYYRSPMQGCLCERCALWEPERSSYLACTLRLEDQKSGDCKISDLVECPDELQEMTCDGCMYYKEIKCKPVPGYCSLRKVV